jgi:hypothetical protein
MRRFNGIVKEIVERYPNIEVSEFLQDEMQLPRDKADLLASRIVKRYCQNSDQVTGKQQRKLFEQNEGEPTVKKSIYAPECLSEREFERFLVWLLEEQGYEVQPEKTTSGYGADLVAFKDHEKVAVQALRCPKTYAVTEAAVLLAQQAQRMHGCDKAIIISTGSFTEHAAQAAQHANIELWDRDGLLEKIAQAKKKANAPAQARFPPFEGSLKLSLLALGETKDFLIQPKADGKYDINLPGVKYPLLTFQAQNGAVTRCVFRIKYNEPVTESEGEAVITIDESGNRVGPDEEQAYIRVTQYLEQFLE